MSPSRRAMTTFTSNNNFGVSGSGSAKPAKSTKSKAKKAADNNNVALSSDVVPSVVAAPTPTPEADKTLKIGAQANKPRTCACAPFVPKEHCVALFKGVPAPVLVGAVTQAVVKANGFSNVGVQVEASEEAFSAPIVVDVVVNKDKDNVNDAGAVKEKEGAANATTAGPTDKDTDTTTTPMIIDTPLDAHKDKDLRAFEHDRQRAKHAKERALRRARKENSNSGSNSNTHGHGHGSVRIMFGGASASAGGADERSQSRSRERERWEALDETYVLGGVLRKTQAHAHAHAHGHPHSSHGKSHSRSKSLKNLSAEDDLYFGSPPPTSATPASTPASIPTSTPAQQVLLSDLVTSLSQRTYPHPVSQTQRKKHALSDDEPFEIVPNVRGVIVLDEADFGHGQGNGMDVEDDGWECVSVSSGGGERENVLSYAQVVLGVA